MTNTAKRCGVGVGIVALVVALGTAWLAARARRAAEGEIAALRARQQNLAAELQREEQRSAAAQKKADDSGRAVTPPPTAPPVPAALPAAIRSYGDIIATDPKLELLELRRRRAAFHQEYDDFFRAEGFSPELIAKFEAIYMKRVEREIDLTGARQGQDDAGRQTIVALEKQAAADYEAAVAELLGTERNRRLQEYYRATPMRNILIRGLAGAAAIEGVPLTPQQGDQLVQAALRTTPANPALQPHELLLAVDWDAYEAQARQILTPPQYALFSTMAPPGGFSSRWKYKFDALVKRAQAADAAAAAGGK